MKNVLIFICLGMILAAPAFAQNTWTNSSIETRTQGKLTIGALAQYNDRRTYTVDENSQFNLYVRTIGNRNATNYGLYNTMNTSGTGTRYGIYNYVYNSTNTTNYKYGLYTLVQGQQRTIGVYSRIFNNDLNSYAGYFDGKVVVRTSFGANMDAFGVWSSPTVYGFLVKGDGRAFANTINVRGYNSFNLLEGTIRYTSNGGFEGYGPNGWGSLGGGGGLWIKDGNDISYDNGNVFIGTTPSDYNNPDEYMLLVHGKGIFEEVRVQEFGNWPDYVFSNDHNRLKLAELKDFVEKEHHLPGVPSAAEVEAQGGFDLGEMDRVLLEKVEELTLYILELKAENDDLKARIEALEK
ncbi:MAG: hypothetical protein AAF206_00380 [Bacteroidota bacterium]